MGEFYDDISENHAECIKKQKVIFVGTAPLDPKGKVNLSPKGYDCFRLISPNQVCYLELTGTHLSMRRKRIVCFVRFLLFLTCTKAKQVNGFTYLHTCE